MQNISDEIYIDLNYLTENERDVLLQVLARDEQVRKQEKRRIISLKNELEECKNTTKPDAESKCCARCTAKFGVVFNTGAFCPKCAELVCKLCRKESKSTVWLCSLCAKIRQVKAESGAWFYEQGVQRRVKPQLHGSQLLRASLRRAKTVHTTSHKGEIISEVDVAEPPSPPILAHNFNHNKAVHKPVPVRMSSLKESVAGDHSDENALDEVNRNYMSEGTEPEQQWSPDFRGYDERENGIHVEESETESLNHRDFGIEESVANAPNQSTAASQSWPNSFLQNEEDSLEGAPNNWNTRVELSANEESGSKSSSREHSFTPSEVVLIEDGSKVMHEWMRSSLEKVDSNEEDGNEPSSHGQKGLLAPMRDSPSSVTTREYFTPLASPMISEPTSEVSEDSEYRDAGDVTPVPEDFETDEYEPSEGNQSSCRNGSVIHIPEIITPDHPTEPPSHHSSPAGDVTGASNGTGTATAPGTSPDTAQSGDRYKEEDIDSFFTEFHSVNTSGKSLGEQLSLGSRESIVSYYSGAGQGHFGNVTVTGEVQFGLKYNFRHHKLEVQIHRARNIAAADSKKRKSDAYVKAYLLPDKTKGGKRKTKIRKNTLNPEFDEILVFKIGYDEMLTRTLWLALWNHDTFGHNDFLGEVMLGLDVYHESGYTWDDPTPQWYPLQDRHPEQSLLTYCGEIVLALKFVPPDSVRDKKKKKKQGKGELHVCIVEALNLPAKDSNGFSDPFCKCYLLPDTSKKTKQKTPIVRRNLNPKWDFNFVYENVTLEELFDRALELSVWDYDRGTTNDFLGGVRLGLGTKKEAWDDAEGEEVTAWQSLLDSPNEWHRISLPLRSSLDSQCE